MTAENYIEVICPTLFTDSGLPVYVSMASGMNSVAFFGDQWALATALLASHYWFVASKRGGQAGVETYKMEGRLASSTGGVGVLRRDLELSGYGMQYDTLKKTRMAGISISGDDILTYLGSVT